MLTYTGVLGAHTVIEKNMHLDVGIRQVETESQNLFVTCVMDASCMRLFGENLSHYLVNTAQRVPFIIFTKLL